MPATGPFRDHEGGILPDSSIHPGLTLLGAAPCDTRVLSIALTRAPRLVAVDGGADAALAAGLAPERVVGDLDSISPAARRSFADRTDHVAGQDDTDLQKALRLADAPFVLACGFLGRRFDHGLAALTALAGDPRPVVLLSEDDCLCIAPPVLALDLPPGTRVSLWPLAEATGRSAGLRWPIDGLVLRPTGPIGTSNRAADRPDGPVRLALRGGPVALIVPLGALDALLAALPIPRPGD